MKFKQIKNKNNKAITKIKCKHIEQAHMLNKPNIHLIVFWSKMHEIKIWSLYELDKKMHGVKDYLK